MTRRKRAATIAAAAMALIGSTGLDLPDAAAALPLAGTYAAVGTLSAVGLQTAPVTSTPDPAQWRTWPARAWRLDAGPIAAEGVMHGWCDLSKGQGTPSGSFSGFEGRYDGGAWGVSSYLYTLRWTGAGRTLAVTSTIGVWRTQHALSPLSEPPFSVLGTSYHGTLTGTVTLLAGPANVTDLCTDADGLQQPIPVLFEWSYVLQ